MKKQKPKITIEGLSIEGKPCDVTLTFKEGLPNILTESIPQLIATAIKESSNLNKPAELEPSDLLDFDSWTIREKVRFVVLRHCRHGWFTSKDVQEIYDRTFHPEIALATVSTYLARMHKKATIARRGSAAQREYRVKVEEISDEIASILATKT
jgi:hypothetical protein